MNFDREYQKATSPRTPDDFIDSNVQSLIEGRRKNPLPRPYLSDDCKHTIRVVDYYVNDTPGRRETADLMQRIAQGLSIKPQGNW